MHLKLTFSQWNLSLGGDLFKRGVYFTIKFFEGDLLKNGDLFKRVIISRAYGICLFTPFCLQIWPKMRKNNFLLAAS